MISRCTSAAIAVAVIATLGAGCGGPAETGMQPTTATPAPPAAQADIAAPGSTLAQAPTGVAAPAGSVVPAGSPAPITATVLATLPVRTTEAPGYRRAAFGPEWADVDHNGCDTRNDVLRRDLTAVTLRPGSHGCAVDTGTLRDPYTTLTIQFRRGRRSGGRGAGSVVAVDHVVPLAEAWRAGADRWTPERRQAFANDPRNLLATSGALNDAKGDHTAADWTPPAPGFRCRYAAIVTAVKAAYGLSVTRAEKNALTRTLDACPAEPAKAAP